MFGVKSSLVVDLEDVTDVEKAKALGFAHPERGYVSSRLACADRAANVRS